MTRHEDPAGAGTDGGAGGPAADSPRVPAVARARRPGTAWLLALFAVPFYAIAAVAFGYPDPVFNSPVPEWDPRYWDFTLFTEVVQRSLTGDLRPVFLRTLLYVAIALGVCVSSATRSRTTSPGTPVVAGGCCWR